MSKKYTLLLLTFFYFHFSYSQELKRVRHFGKNKGHLKMYVHTPPNIDKSKPTPMVVVLHGCLQCATIVQKQSGWSKLADDNGFYVLYPQQRGFNNPERCFKWYRRKHIYKNRGENYSIKAMVDYMKAHNNIDSSRVYITGLSAGAAMGVIMMADYPETFNSGAIFAGAPYKVATSFIPAAFAFVGLRRKTPEKWGKYVLKQNPGYTGKYPRMIIYQGNNDWVVNKQNGVELMKQWTNVMNVSTSPYETISGYAGVKDIERNAYGNKQKKEAVVFYKINKLNHALLIDPGKCQYQGGRRGIFSKDKNYNSSLFTAYDFGLIPAPVISGKKVVGAMEPNITYSVPENANAKYEWTYPSDCKVVKNDNTNSITLNWGTSSGCINVTETDIFSCKKQYQTLFVNLNEGK